MGTSIDMARADASLFVEVEQSVTMHGANCTALWVSNTIGVYESFAIASEHKSENEAYKDEP